MTTTTTTSGAIADSIAEQYAATMDNLIDDASRMETERDAARQQVEELERRVLYFATKFRGLRDMVCELSKREVHGATIGPLELMSSWELTTAQVTQDEIDAMVPERQ